MFRIVFGSTLKERAQEYEIERLRARQGELLQEAADAYATRDLVKRERDAAYQQRDELSARSMRRGELIRAHLHGSRAALKTLETEFEKTTALG